MKLLILDCKKFKYKLDHKTPVGEEIFGEATVGEYIDPLVIFTAIETSDNAEIIPKVAKDIAKIVKQNKNNLVIINPFAHLSANLAKPEKAIELLNMLDAKLRDYPEFKTIRCIFGWYKEFSTEVKGHGNSQIYREY